MVCLSVTFMHCAQTAEDIDTISFPYVSPMSLLDCVKIWLISDLSVGDIRWQIAAEVVGNDIVWINCSVN